MINLALKPLHDLEAALDAAETLLNDHRGQLTDEVEPNCDRSAVTSQS